MEQIGILVFDEMEVLDFAGPFEVFSVAGELAGCCSVVLIAAQDGPVRARNGLRVLPDYVIGQHLPAIDVLIVPGGDGSKAAMQHPALMAWLQDQAAQVSVVASVCSGARLLAVCGLLQGLEAVTHQLVLEDLRLLDPSIRLRPDLRWTGNGRVYTSGGISAGIDLSLHLVSLRYGEALRQKVQTYMEYGDWTPSDTSTPV